MPILPEDFTEDFLGDVFVLNVVFRVDANDLGQRLHQVLERRLLVYILVIFALERLQGVDDILAIRRLLKSFSPLQLHRVVRKWAQVRGVFDLL